MDFKFNVKKECEYAIEIVLRDGSTLECSDCPIQKIHYSKKSMDIPNNYKFNNIKPNVKYYCNVYMVYYRVYVVGIRCKLTVFSRDQ